MRTAEAGGRRAFTLVEVLIAGAVLVAVLVPLIGLITSKKTDEASEEGISEAVAVAENMMEKLLSNAVPFDAIDPGGGGAGLVKGGPGRAFVQAGFREDSKDGFGPDQRQELEAGFWDGDEPIPGETGNYRHKTVGEKTFYVSFFAGVYPATVPAPVDPQDPAGTRADLEQELTFGFLENPAGVGEPFNFQPADRAEFDHQIIMKRASVNLGGTTVGTLPYTQKAYAVTRGANPTARELPDNTPYFYKDRSKSLPADLATASLIPGWQDPRKADPGLKPDLDVPDQRTRWAGTVVKVIKGDLKPTLGYHPRVLGQRAFGQKNGGLMKLVLGVRFAPYQFSKLRAGDISREFWLVSFKADLEK